MAPRLTVGNQWDEGFTVRTDDGRVVGIDVDGGHPDVVEALVQLVTADAYTRYQPTPVRFYGRDLTVPADVVAKVKAYGALLPGRHVVKYGAEGWTTEHPAECADMSCPVATAVAHDMGHRNTPPRPPGRYVAAVVAGRLLIEREPLP